MYERDLFINTLMSAFAQEKFHTETFRTGYRMEIVANR